MNQLAIDFSAARAAGQRGMRLSAEKAERMDDTLFTRYEGKIDDIIALVELSDTDATGMYEALLHYAKSVKESSKQ